MRVYVAADERFFNFHGYSEFDELRKTNVAFLLHRRGADAVMRIFSAFGNRRVRLSRRYDGFVCMHGVPEHAVSDCALPAFGRAAEKMPACVCADGARSRVRQSVIFTLFGISFRRSRDAFIRRVHAGGKPAALDSFQAVPRKKGEENAVLTRFFAPF